MGEAAFWGLVGASSLLVAAEVAFRFRLSSFVVGLIMAFGVGTLIASVSFELIAPAIQDASTWQVGLALMAGALVFFVGDRLIARQGGENRKRVDDKVGSDGETAPASSTPRTKQDDDEQESEGGSGKGIVLGTVLDGIPESAVLGMSLVSGSGVSVALLAAIWISNFPESLGSTVNLVKSRMAKSRIRLMWLAIVLISAAAAGIGYLIVDASSSRTGALVEAFAAGALLTMIADEMAPEAFKRSQIYAGLATTGGFVLAVLLTTLE